MLSAKDETCLHRAAVTPSNPRLTDTESTISRAPCLSAAPNVVKRFWWRLRFIKCFSKIQNGYAAPKHPLTRLLLPPLQFSANFTFSDLFTLNTFVDWLVLDKAVQNAPTLLGETYTVLPVEEVRCLI